MYALIATVLCLVIAYPLAYTIAFKAGRWRNLLLVLVIAPFFTSFLLRTNAWQTILSDNGTVVGLMHDTGLLWLLNSIQTPDSWPDWLQFFPDGISGTERVLATPLAVILGITYNFLPFMTLPLYASLERIDVRLIEAGTGPVLVGMESLSKGDVPVVLAWRRCRNTADVYSSGR